MTSCAEGGRGWILLTVILEGRSRNSDSEWQKGVKLDVIFMKKREGVWIFSNNQTVIYEKPLNSLECTWYNVHWGTHCTSVQWKPDCVHHPFIAAQHNTRSAHTALCAWHSCLLQRWLFNSLPKGRLKNIPPKCKQAAHMNHPIS